MKSIRQIGTCIGLKKNISLLRDFFGYTESWRTDFADCLMNSNNPGCSTYSETPYVKLSVLEHTKHYLNDHNVHLHIRIPVDAVLDVSINKMIYAMRKVYQKHGLGVIIRSIQNYMISDELWSLDVGATILQECAQILGTTEEQDKIFSQLSGGIDSKHILIIFVPTMSPPANGCASHPSNTPGAVVDVAAGIHTMAHEVGHVLGLLHIDELPEDFYFHHICDYNNLMTGCGTRESSTNLNSDQVEEMIDSDLSFKC
jgi:hypothetical protein